MMTMLERAIAAAANAVGADPQDLRGSRPAQGCANGSRGNGCSKSTPYKWTGIIEEGEVEIVRGAGRPGKRTHRGRS